MANPSSKSDLASFGAFPVVIPLRTHTWKGGQFELRLSTREHQALEESAVCGRTSKPFRQGASACSGMVVGATLDSSALGRHRLRDMTWKDLR